MATAETSCPGCGLVMPRREAAVYDGTFNTSPECWAVCLEVFAAEFGNPLGYGRAHQLTVDAYAVQHAGGPHPDKSVGIHLAGLHLVLDRGLHPAALPPLLQRLATVVDRWPHLEPPAERGALTVLDVALAGSADEHVAVVERWAAQMWQAWSAHHPEVGELVERHLGLA